MLAMVRSVVTDEAMATELRSPPLLRTDIPLRGRTSGYRCKVPVVGNHFCRRINWKVSGTE